MKKYIIPSLAVIIFIAGLASLMLPFLPFGWLFVAMAALLVTPYFHFMKKFINWLGEKDSTGIVGKAGKKAAKLYRWADDHEKAEEMEEIAEENGANDNTDDKKD